MRNPDVYIGGKEDPYIKRWWLIPRNKLPFNIYLHNQLKDDPGEELHDHPWWFISIILKGGYIEIEPGNRNFWKLLAALYPKTGIWKKLTHIEKTRRAGDIIFRKAPYPHRLKLRAGPSWSIIITGRPRRPWGFYTEHGWINHNDHVINENGVSEYKKSGLGV